MKRLAALLLAALLALALAGCGGGAGVSFYAGPTREGETPAIVRTAELTSRETKELRKIVGSLTGVTDDYAVDRLAYYFEGEFTLPGKKDIYYFCPEYNVIYYGHYFGAAAPEQMAWIMGLK